MKKAGPRSATPRAASSSFGSWVSVITAVRESGPSDSIASSGHRSTTSTPGNRSAVANALRGSITIVSNPARTAIFTSGWAMWTAPTTTIRYGGVWAWTNHVSPSATTVPLSSSARRREASATVSSGREGSAPSNVTIPCAPSLTLVTTASGVRAARASRIRASVASFTGSRRPVRQAP